MTPISFALEILLDCETIEKAHKACRKYIKKLESGQATNHLSSNSSVASIRSAAIPQGPVQAPSTQALLAAHGPLPPVPPRIIGGDVDNGDGTKSKRKW
jgi:hypothetical protein